MGIFWGTSLENRRLASHCYVQLSPAWAHDFPSLEWRAVRVYNFSNAPFFPLWQFIVIFCFTLSVCSFCFVYTLSYLHCLLFSAFFSSFFGLDFSKENCELAKWSAKFKRKLKRQWQSRLELSLFLPFAPFAPWALFISSFFCLVAEPGLWSSSQDSWAHVACSCIYKCFFTMKLGKWRFSQA